MKTAWNDIAPFKPLDDVQLESISPEERQAYELREARRAAPLNLRARKRYTIQEDARQSRKATRKYNRAQRRQAQREQSVRVKVELALDTENTGQARKNLLAHLERFEEQLGTDGRRELAKKSGKRGRSWSQLDKPTRLALLIAASQR